MSSPQDHTNQLAQQELIEQQIRNLEEREKIQQEIKTAIANVRSSKSIENQQTLDNAVENLKKIDENIRAHDKNLPNGLKAVSPPDTICSKDDLQDRYNQALAQTQFQVQLSPTADTPLPSRQQPSPASSSTGPAEFAQIDAFAPKSTKAVNADSKTLGNMIDAYNKFAQDENGKYKHGFAEPTDFTGPPAGKLFQFPDENSAKDFFQQQAKAGKEFTIADTKGNVIAYSNGDGKLRGPDNKPLSTDIESKDFAADFKPRPNAPNIDKFTRPTQEKTRKFDAENATQTTQTAETSIDMQSTSQPETSSSMQHR